MDDTAYGGTGGVGLSEQEREERGKRREKEKGRKLCFNFQKKKSPNFDHLRMRERKTHQNCQILLVKYIF